jgi:uncharacterized protein YtpQ (UPF0354 family)
MTRMPEDPGRFALTVKQILEELKPHLEVELAQDQELIVEGRRLDLQNLQRLVSAERERGVEIVEQYLTQLFDDETFSVTEMTWEQARPRIMPRIQPETIFEHLSRDLVAHVPFVNETVIVFVIDLPNMTVSVTTEQMLRWGVCPDELDEVARENLDNYAPAIEFKTVENEAGGRAVLLSMQDGYDASRLLMTDLYQTLGPEFGGDFLVATPSRDLFLACSQGDNGFVSRIRDRVAKDYSRLPYPITERLFYVCRDGVAGTTRRQAA